TPDPIGQQARWLEQLEEFDYAIEHRPGKRHGNADALSRRPCPKRDCVCREENQSGEGVNVSVDLPLFGGPADPHRPPFPVCNEWIEGVPDSADSAYRPHVDTFVAV